MPKKMNIIDKLHQEFVVDKIKETDWVQGSTGPLVVELDTTEVCNLACPGCISEDLVCNKTSFSAERLLQLAEEMYEIGVKAVILIGGGEPLAHPAVGELIQYLGEHDIRIGITTNGSFIDRHIDVIAEYASWTRVSMDAATQETFDKLRPAKNGVSEFEHIVGTMQELSKKKKGELGFSFLVRTEADGFGIESNIHEIYPAALLAKKCGCDYFEVKPSYSYVGGQAHSLVVHAAERMEEARREIARLDELAEPGFRIVKAINMEDSLARVEHRQEKSYETCPVAELRTLVCPSGVYVCPYWRGKDQFRIGDAQTQSFSDIWNGARRREVRKFVDPCTVCSFHCLRHESNMEVLRIIEQDRDEIQILDEYDRFI
jgi:MoaA/NifB/PqqE/SkfB family radical SAM enzyme